MKYDVLKDGSIRYNNVRIDMRATERFPDMVEVTKAPARMKALIGKRYIDMVKCILAIDDMVGEALIGSEKLKVRFEMVENGIISITEI